MAADLLVHCIGGSNWPRDDAISGALLRWLAMQVVLPCLCVVSAWREDGGVAHKRWLAIQVLFRLAVAWCRCREAQTKGTLL